MCGSRADPRAPVAVLWGRIAAGAREHPITEESIIDRAQAIELAQTVGGTAHPVNPYDREGDWYVLGERDAETRKRSRWELRDGKPSIVENADAE